MSTMGPGTNEAATIHSEVSYYSCQLCIANGMQDEEQARQARQMANDNKPFYKFSWEVRQQIISPTLGQWDNIKIRRLIEGEPIPLPPCARGSVRMRSETVQLILERYEAVILNEDDGLALNRFLQRENAYNHIQSLSFPVIFSLRDAQLTMACSELHELHLHLTCIQSCRTMHELIRHLSLDRILEHKKILNIYLHLQCPCLWSDNVPAPGSGQWHGEELAQWLSDEFELRRPGDVKIHMSTWRGRITTIIV